MGTPLVKVLTGIRRCGKSSILSLLETDLRKGGVPQERILSINMESLEFDDYRDYRVMNRFVKERLPSGGHLLLDEVQAVEGWERLVSSLLAEGSVECIITGSNASLYS
jgi:predicted AAA+ superfamily ATPase